MQIEICFSPSLIQLYEHRDSVVVVTDVFRATTTICTAFANGASYIIPVATEQEALAYKSLGHLVGAEQATERCSFADFGNSPSEYSVDKVNGKSIVFMTTNGTKAIKGAADCYQLLIGAFVNLRALTERILSLGKDVLIVCSGANGRICLEDSLFAGALTSTLLAEDGVEAASDGARMAVALWHQANRDFSNILLQSEEHPPPERTCPPPHPAWLPLRHQLLPASQHLRCRSRTPGRQTHRQKGMIVFKHELTRINMNFC